MGELDGSSCPLAGPVDPHTRALSALIELLHPFPGLTAGDVAARLDGRPAGQKLLGAVRELREVHPWARADGRTWWPVGSSGDVYSMLGWLVGLGRDPWGRRVAVVSGGRWGVEVAAAVARGEGVGDG